MDPSPFDAMDTDIMAFLESTIGDIKDDPTIDSTFGADEVDAAFDDVINGVALGGARGGDKDTNVDTNVDAKIPPKFDIDAEPIGEIDPNITSADMMVLIYAEVMKKRIAGHHIDSMNTFYRDGIKQIVTKVFTVEGIIKNTRDKTDEDKEIAEIHYEVDFTDINLKSPTTVKYRSGATQMLTPNMARLMNLTYSVQMEIDATITATATYKNGNTKVRTDTIKNYRIGAFPAFVHTELCNMHNCSKETLKAYEEDPLDPGGYSIIKGFEWTVDNLENITNNTFHVYRNSYMNELARGMFLSKPGDAFENSYQVIIRYLNTGMITIEITTNKFDKFEIPFYIIFRALGMTRDKDIVNNIVYGVNNTDAVTTSMLEILDKAFLADDTKFGAIRQSTNPTEIIQYIAHKINETANLQAARKDDNIAKYLNNNILNIIDRYIFPHIGTAAEHRIRKLRFFGHLINKLLLVNMQIVEPTDRDSYRNKRVHAAGTSMAKSFKQGFNFAIVQEIKKHLSRDFRSTPFSQVQLADSVKTSIRSEDLERMLMKAITNGNSTITIRRNEIINRISSQTLYHKNDMNVKSTLNTINTPSIGNASKQNERADVMRRVHPTYLGYIDQSQSADTGEKVGMTKQLACTASVSAASSSFILKQIILDDPDLINLDEVKPEQVTYDKLAKVFVNGEWLGCCKESHKMVHKYRMWRRHHKIHFLTTIVWEPLIREIYFWTDVGRLVRPLVIVYNNLTEYITKWRKGDRSVKFRQWIKLTKEHIRRLQTKQITMDDLRQERVIEYISPEEQENALLSPDIDTLREHELNLRRQFTHCDIPQAIFGLVTLAGPMANHSNAVRNTMYTNHRKQAAGWFALNYPFRIDKNTTFQHYCERPLVSTFSDALTYPNGQNTIVALQLYRGENQEDSTIVNQSSVDCGMFNASHYNYEKAELDKNEQFGNPDYARTMDIKKDAIYEYVENGFITENTLAKRGYVLIVKTVKIPKPVDQYMYIDKSIVYKRDEPVYIERVITTRNADDQLIAKVKWRANRPLNVGDKLSSRSGNKGITAKVLPRCDMPYCEDGMVPDIIVNAHSIPTRMAVNQLIECVYAQIGAKKGCFIDGTVFREHNIDAALEELEKLGVKYGGHRRMYNGMTGDWIDTLIFVGPTTYQRLQKYVIDEQYAMRTGPTSALTRQPLDGKNNDGGLKIGEMEKDVYCAHGSMRALFDKFYKDSDGIRLPICRICGNRAVVNEKAGIYKCKYCGDNADIADVSSSWVANLFFSEASAMNVKMKFELDPFTYSKSE